MNTSYTRSSHNLYGSLYFASVTKLETLRYPYGLLAYIVDIIHILLNSTMYIYIVKKNVEDRMKIFNDSLVLAQII